MHVSDFDAMPEFFKRVRVIARQEIANCDHPRKKQQYTEKWHLWGEAFCLYLQDLLGKRHKGHGVPLVTLLTIKQLNEAFSELDTRALTTEIVMKKLELILWSRPVPS